MTNYSVKGAKRSVKMWTTNFYKSFYKSILLYMSSWLSKIRSVHTYDMLRTVYFGWICNRYSRRLTQVIIENFIYSTVGFEGLLDDFSKDQFIFASGQHIVQIQAIMKQYFMNLLSSQNYEERMHEAIKAVKRPSQRCNVCLLNQFIRTKIWKLQITQK